MPKKHNLKIPNVSKTQLFHLDRGEQLEFWRAEYTKRKFLLDDRAGIIDLRELSKCIVKIEQALKIPPLYFLPSQQSQDIICSLVEHYHSANNKNPKYAFSPIYFDEIDYKPLLMRFENELKILHHVTFTYGYHLNVLPFHMAGKDIVTFICEHNRLPPPPYSFLRYTDDKKHDCRFNYKCRDGIQFFEEEQDGIFYIYCEAASEEFSITDFLLSWPGRIRNYKRTRQNWGDRDTADMQICLNIQQTKLSHDKLKKWITLGVNAYRNWVSPEYSLHLQTFDVAWAVDGLEREQLPALARAMGLWLWDITNSGETLETAMDVIITSSKVNESVRYDEISSAHRDLDRTKDFISAMEVSMLTKDFHPPFRTLHNKPI